MAKFNHSERLLLIFLKNPVPGRVKTRLAATTGDEKASHIYKKLIAHTRKVVQPLQIKKELWYSDFIPENDDWPESPFEKKLQQGADLGRRMQFSFKTGFEQEFKKIVIIGTDCAKLQTAHIQNAFEALDKNEAVIGPATDGGYYLLGLKRFVPALFGEKKWGTDMVLNQTVKDFKTHNISFQQLEELRDIDTEEDWNQVKGIF